MQYPNFRKLVEALQSVPHEATIAKFLYNGVRGLSGGTRITFAINLSHVVPLIEAIGMRLKWCQEQSIDHLPPSPEKPFSGDAVLDAWGLLFTLSELVGFMDVAGLSLRTESVNLLNEALSEIGELNDKVLTRWEAIGKIDKRFRAREISEEELEESFNKITSIEEM